MPGPTLFTGANGRFFDPGTPDWTYGDSSADPTMGNGSHTITQEYYNKSGVLVATNTGPAIDCSNLVYQSALAAGYTVSYHNSASLNSIYSSGGSSDYSKIDPNKVQVQAGDIVLFNGHVGIV